MAIHLVRTIGSLTTPIIGDRTARIRISLVTSNRNQPSPDHQVIYTNAALIADRHYEELASVRTLKTKSASIGTSRRGANPETYVELYEMST